MPEAAFPVVEDAPAKVNLALHVTGRRTDGYHLLESLVVFTRFGDRLTAAPAQVDGLGISGPFGEGLAADQSNLVIRARDAFRSHLNIEFPVALSLQKNLPLASGIGGGSSDAAATLRALSRLCGFDGDPGALALQLGADVPMCLAAKSLIAKGIGETLSPVPDMPELAMVLVNPGVHVATPAVFAGLDGVWKSPLPSLPRKLDLAALVEWLRKSRNDLQEPAEAVAPEISEVLTALRGTDPAFARMSGSGATCFGIYPDMAGAQQAAQAIRRHQPGWFVAATTTMA